MQIDWLTVSAQIVNFLILVWLLKRFLYRPVIDAMARREERIAARLDEAEQREAEADARGREYAARSEALERTRAERIAEAQAAAEHEKRRLLDVARQDVDAQRQSWLEELRLEQDDLRKALKRELAETVVDVSRRALSSLADAELERQIVEAFLRRLTSMTAHERELLARDGALRLSSSFDVDAAILARIRGALGADELEHRRDPELVCGIALTSAERRLEWNVAAWLTELDDRIDGLLAEPAGKRRAAA